MADSTRFKDLHDTQNKLDQLLQTEIMRSEAADIKIQEQISGINKKFERLTHTLTEIQLQLSNVRKGFYSSESFVLGVFASSHGSHKSRYSLNYAQSSLPRIDFPTFDGTNLRSWILKCKHYFTLMPNIPNVQKVNLATIHFEGKTLMWYQNLNIGEIRITWEQFLEVVCARFEDLKVTNIIMEFNKLKQDGTYDDYVERFEELMACMVLPDESKYSEEHYIACFLSGLSEELRAFIHMSQPETLHQAIELGQKQLLTLDVIPKKWQPPDDDEAIFEAQKAIEFGIPEVDINMVEIVEKLQGFVDPTFGEEGFVPRRAVGIVENQQLNIPFSPRLHKVEGYNLMLGRDRFMFCPPIKWDYINMTFTTFLNWKKVKFKFLTRALVMTLITCSDLCTYSFTGSVLNTLLHEEITYADEIVLANAAGYATPTLALDLILDESSDIFVANKKMEER